LLRKDSLPSCCLLFFSFFILVFSVVAEVRSYFASTVAWLILFGSVSLH
jgi:hypothetical protein